MKDHETGLSRRFFNNGRNYKRERVFKTEEEANRYVKELEERHGSKRFCPVVERMRWAVANNGILRRFGFTRYRVYVPIMEK